MTEVLTITPEIAGHINAGASTRVITATALKQGMTRLIDNAVRFALEGKTSIDEVMTLCI